MICRVSKKKKKFSTEPVYKYGVEVARNIAYALKLDEANGNAIWKGAIEKKIEVLLGLDYFGFHPAGYHNTLDATWQRTILHMVFDIKQDLKRKCRLVAGGHLVDMLDIQIYFWTVKSINMQLLHVI